MHNTIFVHNEVDVLVNKIAELPTVVKAVDTQ